MDEALYVMLPTALVIIGGVVLLYVALQNASRVRELKIKERIALIEKGIVPPPETDPAGFERAMGQPGGSTAARRSQSAGVLMIGLGAALFFLIGVTGESPSEGLGIGGAFAVVGLALIVNARTWQNAPGSPDRLPATHSSPAPTHSEPLDRGPDSSV